MSQSIQISPEAYAVVRNLRDTTGVMATICRVMDQQNELTTGYIQQNFLSGPGKKDQGTLAVVTGYLRRSVRPVPARNHGGVIFSGIGSNVVYAAAHEFGVDEEVSVPAHSRRNPHGDRFDVSGVTLARFTALRAGLLTKKQAGRRAVESGKYTFARRGVKQVKQGATITVRAHQMHMRLPARRMFTRGIEARLQTYGTAISTAIINDWGRK